MYFMKAKKLVHVGTCKTQTICTNYYTTYSSNTTKEEFVKNPCPKCLAKLMRMKVDKDIEKMKLNKKLEKIDADIADANYIVVEIEKIEQKKNSLIDISL
jgi:hypothetical protein